MPLSGSRRCLPVIRGVSSIRAIALLTGILLASGTASAQLSVDPAQTAGKNPALFQKIRFDQRLGAKAPLDLSFVDEHGHDVLLRQFFGQGPVVLILAYYTCPMLCTEVLNGSVRALRQLNLELGKDYQVLTISIDPEDSPALAATKHEEYAVKYGRPGAERGWHFLTGAGPQIEQLAAAIGFQYAYDPVSRQFAHASGLVILTPQGTVSQYLYGVSFQERDLRLGLVRASHERIGSLVDHVLLYCYHFDPHTGKYGLLISRVLEITAGLTALLLGGLIFALFRKESYALPE